MGANAEKRAQVKGKTQDFCVLKSSERYWNHKLQKDQNPYS